MKNFKKIMVTGMVSSLFSFGVMAASDANLSISVLGVQGGNGYVHFNENLSIGCPFGNVYVANFSDPASRAMYATLLAARSSNRKISRVSYEVSPAGLCVASLIELGSSI